MANSPEAKKQPNASSENLIPGQLEVSVPGLTDRDSVSSGIKKGGIAGLVEKLHDEGKHVVALRRPGKMVLYVATSVGLIGAIAGGVYLRKRKKNG